MAAAATVELRVAQRGTEVWATVTFTNRNPRADVWLDPYALGQSPQRDLFDIAGPHGRVAYAGLLARCRPLDRNHMVRLRPRASHSVQLRLDDQYGFGDAVAGCEIRYLAWHGGSQPATAWYAATAPVSLRWRPPLRIDVAARQQAQQRLLAQAKADLAAEEKARAAARAASGNRRAVAEPSPAALAQKQAAALKAKEAERAAEVRRQQEVSAAQEKLREQVRAAARAKEEADKRKAKPPSAAELARQKAAAAEAARQKKLAEQKARQQQAARLKAEAERLRKQQAAQRRAPKR